MNKLKLNDKKILVISDLQIPFEHKDAYDFLEWLTEEVEPDLVVNVGDEVDQHTLSRYASDPDGLSGGDEHAAAVRALQRHYKLHPEVLLCTSNHTDRIYKRAFGAGIPRAYLKSIKEFLKAPKGWEWADEWWIDGIRFSHGDEAGGVVPHRTLLLAEMASVVIGHHHSNPGIEYISNGRQVVFGMNVGCLIDPAAYAFNYTKKNKFKPILGTGLIMGGVPTWVPMLLNSRGRWDSKNQKKIT